jgi:glycosyltransferase involved in cell wall biosynthesis
VSAEPVTVAIPVWNGGTLLADVLAAVRAQELDRPLQLLVADSGSTDGSRELAAANGAELIDVAPGEFSHGATRNRLAEQASGSHVAFLTQDSVPADSRWLARLLDALELDEDAALSFGPYRPRAGSSPMVRRELSELFASFAPDGRPRVDRAGGPHEGKGLGRAAFFSDANGCVARAAWERVPFRDVPYAEDQLLARDMLAAGYAKAYHPGAAVVHSHDYPPAALLRRSFDEWRALAEVHGQVAPAGPLRAGLIVQRELRDDLALMRREGAPPARLAGGALQSARHHLLRTAGAALGSRAERLPAALRRALSLEGRE